MARSMIRRLQEIERERIDAYEATLRRISAKARPAPDFVKALTEAQDGFDREIIREPDAWRPKMKTRNPARLRLAAARHLFALYPVPAPLEQVWLDSEGLAADEIRLRKRWYVIVAGGGSLYRQGAREWLTRREVHHLLNPPGPLAFEEAVWQAVARSYTDDPGIALRIARSRVARSPRAEFAFWREVARFFAVNPVRIEEIDDFCDYLADSHRRDAGYTVTGRTLGSLRRQMREWHRDLETVARIEAARRRVAAGPNGGQGGSPEGGRWSGSPLADWSWHPTTHEARKNREEYTIVQLHTATELVAESRVMRHCVWTYAGQCIAGRSSIWSLRRHRNGGLDHLLTIELDSHGRAVQIRGFANRLARADERKVLERWSKARGVSLP